MAALCAAMLFLDFICLFLGWEGITKINIKQRID
jgi:hypothetical protein